MTPQASGSVVWAVGRVLGSRYDPKPVPGQKIVHDETFSSPSVGYWVQRTTRATEAASSWWSRTRPPRSAGATPRSRSAASATEAGSTGAPAAYGRGRENRGVPNRLAKATSPYLLQHADNPVDWREWGDEAFAEAERTGRPVLLSVGYAACHWCHVMAHESFEDEATAALMNERFVNIKVDREERPDVDTVYMAATQALTGQGGWPMTVFLTPDRKPFYAGTYFPPTPRQGMPAFCQVLDAVSAAWTDRREEVVSSAAGIAAQLAEQRLVVGAGHGHPGRPRGRPDDARARLRPHVRGLRPCAQVPAVDGAGGAAARRERAGAGDGRAHRHGDGPRRDLRPARRRVRALQRRRALGRAALREDALRQRPAARRLHAPVAAYGRPARGPGGRRRRSTGCWPSSGRRRARSPRASTPTPSTPPGTCTRARSTPGRRRT